MIAQVLMGAGAAALAAFGVVSAVRTSKETAKRRTTPVEWDPRFPQEAFEGAVHAAARKLPRVYEVEIHGLIITIHVKSNSGLTRWKAEIDFCDYGRLTGRNWVTTENNQSPIPNALAEAVVTEVDARLGAGQVKS